MNENMQKNIQIAPIVRFTDASFTWQSDDEAPPRLMFDHFTADIPAGFISLTGPNGSGKTTFMLLAGARILPDSGKIQLCGQDTRVLAPPGGLTPELEHARNLVCSFLYQNMEFDTDDSDDSRVGTLLEYVFVNGGHLSKSDSLFAETVDAFELSALKGRKLVALSKGEVQRVLLAFSALYGSRVIMMDEPVFAMEQRQKEKALEFFRELHVRTGVSVVVSLHELALSRKYADTAMLFYPDRKIDLGTCEEVLTKEALEKAYGVPEAMLHDTERLARNCLLEAEAIKKAR